MRKINRNMCEGPMFWNIIFYTIPIILSSFLQLLFNAADLVIVGRFCGIISVGAVGATTSLIHLISNLFMGISVGAGVTVAQAIGANNLKAVSRAVHTAIPIAAIGGIVLSVIGVLFSEKLLMFMGTPENVLKLSTIYMKIYFGGMFFNMIYNFGASILRAAGDTKRPLIYLTIAGVLNVALNVIFVTVFNMDVAGVALATTISQAVSAILIMISLIRSNESISFRFKDMIIDKKSLLKMLSIGLPSGIQASLFALSNVLIQSSVNSFGEVFVSGNAATQSIEGFVYVSMNAFYQSSMNFSGQNYGAKKFNRIKNALFICTCGAIFIGLLLGISSYIFGKELLSIYITNSAQAIKYGMIRLSIISTLYFLCGVMETITGAIRGMGYSTVTLFISVIGACGLRIVWVYTIFAIPKYHTPTCLFLSYPITWTITAIAELIAFLIIYKKEKRKYEVIKV